MAMSPDGCVLSPVFEADTCVHQLLGNMGGRVLLHHVLHCSSLADGWLATVWRECWTRWTLGLIQHGTSYVLIWNVPLNCIFNSCLEKGISAGVIGMHATPGEIPSSSQQLKLQGYSSCSFNWLWWRGNFTRCCMHTNDICWNHPFNTTVKDTGALF